MTINTLYNTDCISFMCGLDDKSVDLTLTDIPYSEVSRKSNGLRNLNKGNADIITFSIDDFLEQVFRITKYSIVIFCGMEQFSSIHNFFSLKSGRTSVLVWEKSNPSPMNGKHIYLSGIEMSVWFTYQDSPFASQDMVHRFPTGRSKIHPTEKNHQLLKEIILSNTQIDDIVFDPCAGSGAHLLVAKENNRKFLGCEIDGVFFDIAKTRLAQ